MAQLDVNKAWLHCSAIVSTDEMSKPAAEADLLLCFPESCNLTLWNFYHCTGFPFQKLITLSTSVPNSRKAAIKAALAKL